MGASHSALPANVIPADSFNVVGRDGALYANGVQFHIKGANWFGSEAYCGPPNGLDKHTIGWYMDFLARNNFNAIRLLFNHEHVLKNDIVNAPSGEKLLFQTRYIDMFVILAREAAKRGILVMIGCHRLTHDAWPGDGLWYDGSISVARVKESWTALANALCGEWNVFAADLQNEPHAASWGKGLLTDWNKAAELLGNHVNGLCSRLLIMVEGVGYTPGAPGADDPGMGMCAPLPARPIACPISHFRPDSPWFALLVRPSSWWGENLVGTNVAPVHLKQQDKLVYSPHVYGPSVYMQKYFTSPFFPTNMPAIWQQHFAFAKAKTGRPIVIGELGGSYVGPDRVWQDWAIPYMADQGFGVFYFALNPDSKDTGGLVPSDDWSDPPTGSAEALKLVALARLPSTNVFTVCPACQAAQQDMAVPVQPPPPVQPTPAAQPPPPPFDSAPPSLVTSPPSIPAFSPEKAGMAMPQRQSPQLPPPPMDLSVSSSKSTILDLSEPQTYAWLCIVVAVVVHLVRKHKPGKDASNTVEPQPHSNLISSTASNPRRKSKAGRRLDNVDRKAEQLGLLLHDAEHDASELVQGELASGNIFAAGERVRIFGLQQEPHLNGLCGFVAAVVHNPDGAQRCNVVCDSTDGAPKVGLCVRPENLLSLAAVNSDSELQAVTISSI